MNAIVILIGLVVAAVLVFFLIYHTNTASNSVLHTVVYDKTTLYSGNTTAIVTSDGSSNILIGTAAGLLLYSTDTQTTTKLNASVATGLAYDGQDFMELEGDGTLSSIIIGSTTNNGVTTFSAIKTEIATGYTKLYDTIDGYLTTVGGYTTVTGASGVTTPANGNYGIIQVAIT